MAVLGSLTTTVALVLPSVIMMILISKMFLKYMKTPIVQSIFSGLRPVVVGLLAAATLLLCNAENFSAPSINPWQFWISLFLFAAPLLDAVDEDKPYPHDMLCRSCRVSPALLRKSHPQPSYNVRRSENTTFVRAIAKCLFLYYIMVTIKNYGRNGHLVG